jgi:hypothetical protein
MATYRIHPGIGIARLGNSESAFYLAPETPAALPLACDSFGNPLYGPDGVTPVPVKAFKDPEGRVKRQAARFQIFVYDDSTPEGRPLAIGWRAAAITACWSTFSGASMSPTRRPPGTRSAS